MRKQNTDTIAAISTAMAPAGIGIVRISGPEAIAIADSLFRAKNARPLSAAASHTIQYGHIEARGKLLDEVLVSVLRGPKTYTREDIVEINCHGGNLVLRRVLDAVLSAGARLAAPGEFTRRAFLNGRIDLSQAEAVMDLIASENKRAADSALSQLSGALRQKTSALREQILQETATIEAALDDPEHYDLTGYGPRLAETLRTLQEDIQNLLATAEEGRIVREGLSTVILGRPNVGKSTLLNLLSGSERAIVTEIAGTTRDVLEEQVVLCGVPLRLMDTAGLRESEDRIEQIGVARAQAQAEAADLILYVLDGAAPLSEEDKTYLRRLGERPTLLILNKSDQAWRIAEEEAGDLLPGARVVRMSAQNGDGLSLLGETIRDLFFRGETQENQEVYITNIRHKEALQEARESLEQVLQSVAERMPEDLYTVDLMDAYAALGRITGEEVGEDLIDRIFSEFCMGK